MCPTGTTTLEHVTKPVVQKSNLRSAFDILDVDGDGKISYDDLKSFNNGFSNTMGEDVIGSMIAAADCNENGYVEYDEFEKVLNGRKKGHGGVMEEAFRVMDKDGDGKVGHQDLKSYLNWAGIEAHDEDIKAMIKLGGGEIDGGVTFQGLLKILAF